MSTYDPFEFINIIFEIREQPFDLGVGVGARIKYFVLDFFLVVISDLTFYFPLYPVLDFFSYPIPNMTKLPMTA